MAYSLSGINESVRSDPREFSQRCDEEFQKKVHTAAEKIAEHRSESRIILLSGPSGSGKTTTALKIEDTLKAMDSVRTFVQGVVRRRFRVSWQRRVYLGRHFCGGCGVRYSGAGSADSAGRGSGIHSPRKETGQNFET